VASDATELLRAVEGRLNRLRGRGQSRFGFWLQRLDYGFRALLKPARAVADWTAPGASNLVPAEYFRSNARRGARACRCQARLPQDGGPTAVARRLVHERFAAIGACVQTWSACERDSSDYAPSWRTWIRHAVLERGYSIVRRRTGA